MVHFSQLFCDFGEEFIVLDRDGETPMTAMINYITKVTSSNTLVDIQVHSFLLFVKNSNN